MLTLSDFDYPLPEERIAQTPLERRPDSRLLQLHRTEGTIEHGRFADILDFFKPGDVLVLNNSRVIPARLFGSKSTGGKVELLLLDRHNDTDWNALVGGKKLNPGVDITIHDHANEPSEIKATVLELGEGPLRQIRFSEPTEGWLSELGYVPLPPYIHNPIDDPERYQTVYAQRPGSSAAPTAGLHFNSDVLLELRSRGVLIEYVTLHIGLDTFKPVEVDEIQSHQIHTEWASLTAATAERINNAKLAGGRLVAVGTTAMRTLETASLRSAGLTGSLQTISARDAAGETTNFCPWKPVAAIEEQTDLFIYPGYLFRAVDALLTNFHMPKSTLMMLVSAFAGRDSIQAAYAAALAEEYRFLSLGDAMFIHP